MQLPAKLSRYAAVARLFVRHRATLTNGAGNGNAEGLTHDLEQLGPTFAKLGQILSTRTDLLPAAYTAALSRLQDDVQPFPFSDVERIVEEELGARISKAFGLFEAKPIAAASLGQAHRAALRDGRFVAVKVQRPGIGKQVEADMAVLAEIALFADRHGATNGRVDFSEIVEEFRKTTLEELDTTTSTKRRCARTSPTSWRNTSTPCSAICRWAACCSTSTARRDREA